MSVRNGVQRRGTSNRNDRGSVETRRRRREWLVTNWRADVDVMVMRNLPCPDGQVRDVLVPVEPGDHCPERQPACRCYRCGQLLTVDTVTADRIVPGCQGGTYRRDNIRPACGRCNSVTGGAVRGPLSSGKGKDVVKITPRRNGRRLGSRNGAAVSAPAVSGRMAASCDTCGAGPGFSCNTMVSVRQVAEGREGAYLKPMAGYHRGREVL